MTIQMITTSQVGVASVTPKILYHNGLTNIIDEPETEKTIRMAITSQFEFIPHLLFNFSITLYSLNSKIRKTKSKMRMNFNSINYVPANICNKR